MHRLFTIEHLVGEICSHVPHSILPTVARVSSIWFQSAIPYLYRSLGMQNALGPLGKTINEDETWKFVMSARNDEGFKRFSKYTTYVQTLYVYPVPPVVSIALEAMSKSILSGGIPYLFPNVQRLTWDSPEYTPESIELSIGLISPKIDQLDICTKDDRMLRSLCTLVMTRLPALRHVSIADSWTKPAGYSTLVKPVQDLLKFFTHTLTSVAISHSLNTPSIVECLSKMPNLRNLSVQGNLSNEEQKRDEIVCRDEEGFTSLLSFSFDDTPQSFNDMYSNPYSLTSLTTLTLPSAFTLDDIGKFISSIVVGCPRIQSLSFGDNYIIGLPPQPVVPWSSIQLLSGCKELSSLRFITTRVSADLDELTKFLSSRATWKHLNMVTSTPLRLQDMILYAKYCPNLEHLVISLSDADNFCVEDLPSELPTFSSITSIRLVSSNISASYSLAQLLYRICKKPPYELEGPGKIPDDVFKRLAISYFDEHCETGNPMSREVKEFIRRVIKQEMST